MPRSIDHLLEVMKRLRDPERGCPWDVKQNHKTLARYMLEEAYEVIETIEDSGPEPDTDHLCEELGDVLLQIVFHAQIASENGDFTFENVAQNVADKMVERHPHVFGDRDVNTAEDVLKNWENDKAQKRLEKAQLAQSRLRVAEGEAQSSRAPTISILDDVNTALPAVSRALKLQSRAARVGFEWKNPIDVVAKIHEEMGELEAEIQKDGRAENNTNKDAIEDELGDVLFVVTNLARQLKIDPERALRRTNRKFETRFRGIETALLAQNRQITDACIEELEALWLEMKAKERAAG